ncbi:MAG: MFS transporter [Acidimicrobiales bacterium]|jgi:MFS family permease
MTMRDLAKSRDARVYLIGQSFSLFGDTAMFLALGIWVKELTHSNADAGLTFLFFPLAALFSPIAGMVVDRVRRRPTLICVNFLSAALVMLLLFVHNSSDIWIVYLTMFLYSFAGNFIGSAQSAFLTTLLPTEQLGDANGFLRTVREGLRLVAPLAGAGLFVIVGGHWIAALDASTFVIAGVSVLLLHVREEKPVRAAQHFFVEISAGFHHVARTPILRRMAISLAVALTVVGFLETVIFAVTSEELHRSPSFIGVLMAVQGVGALIGGPLSAPTMRRIGERWLCGIGLIGIVLGSLLLEGGSLVPVLMGGVFFGVALPPLLVGAYTLLQLRTPSELQGRAFSAFDLIASLPQTMSIALGAILVTVVGYKWELTILAVVVSIAALIMLLPIEGEPNFGPLVMSEGPDLTLVDEVLTRPSELN